MRRAAGGATVARTRHPCFLLPEICFLPLTGLLLAFRWWPLLTSLADEYIVLHDRRHEELTLPDSAFQGGDILQQTGGVPEPLRNRGWRLWVVHVPARPPP